MPILLDPHSRDAASLDAAQQAAVAHRGPLLRVLGGPGTGKTTVVVELVADWVDRGQVEAHRVVALAASRRAAARLRERLVARLGRTTREPVARTVQSLAYAVLHTEAVLAREPRPRLITGPEQDAILAELLAGHAAGLGAAPPWPPAVVPALRTRGFRAELRDLLMRSVEAGLTGADLVDLGTKHGRPEWSAAGAILDEYLAVSGFARPGGFDPAAVVRSAVGLLADDEEALARFVKGIGLVVVDDAQELTPAAAELLGVLAGAGVAVVLVGDPDETVLGFRGSDPGFLTAGWAALGDGVAAAETVVLHTDYRQGTQLREVAARVVDRIGPAGSAERRLVQAAGTAGGAEVLVARSAAHEAALIAQVLREAAVTGSMNWSDMAVIVRGRGRAATLRRALDGAGVPVDSADGAVPLRDEPVVAALLMLVEVAGALAAEPGSPPPWLDGVVVADLLSSPLGGADGAQLRRLRRRLRAAAGRQPGTLPQIDPSRIGDELLVAALCADLEERHLDDEDPEKGDQGERESAGGGGGDQDDHAALRRLRRALAAGVSRLRAGAGAHAEAGARHTSSSQANHAAPASAEDVLWAMWAATGWAPVWRRAALSGGARGRRADHDLDAVVAILAAASTFADRLPHAGPQAFVDQVRSEEVAADSLVPTASGGARVVLTTPQQAAGRQWRLVIVAGVQQGVWPDLRVRDTLLGAGRLVDAVRGLARTPREEVAQVRQDELRFFYVAVTRAVERLVVTAVRNDDDQPSPFIDLVDPRPEEDGPRPYAGVAHPMTLPGLVARLRQVVVRAAADDLDAGTGAAETGAAEPGATERGEAEEAAAALALLAAAEVPGAHPDDWWDLRPTSTTAPRLAEGSVLALSPSKVEAFGQCGLRWFLQGRGADRITGAAVAVGQLVHDVAATLPDDADVVDVREQIDQRWADLGAPPGWQGERLRAQAHQMGERLVAYWRSSTAEGWRRAGAEEAVDVVVGTARIRGSIDRVEVHADGRVRIVDYKTGASVPTKLADHPQLATYQLAVRRGGVLQLGPDAVAGGAALVRLGKAATVSNPPVLQDPLDDEAEVSVETLVTNTAAGMRAGTFTATAGDHCRTCPVQSCCPLRPEGDAP